jgi:hypothetical protein
MMHVRITMNGALTVPTPAQLFDASAYASWGVGASPRAYYDVTADGQRFLMLRPVQGAASAPPQLVLIQNWTEELKQRVPTRDASTN